MSRLRGFERLNLDWITVDEVVNLFSFDSLETIQVSPELEIEVMLLKTSNNSFNVLFNWESQIFIKIWIQTPYEKIQPLGFVA